MSVYKHILPVILIFIFCPSMPLEMERFNVRTVYITAVPSVHLDAAPTAPLNVIAIVIKAA